MEEKKKEKKGFWSTLFSPKSSCGCSCGGGLIEEVPEDENKEEKKSK